MTTADHPSPPRPARPLRRDAQRNRDAILAAARQVFCDHGLEAPLEEIARRAGVGIATLYRRFPSRVELLDAVLADTVQAHVDAAEQALATDDPWGGFTYYLEATCRLQAADRGLNDAMGMRLGQHPHPAGRPRRRRPRRLAAAPRLPAGRLPRRPRPPAAPAAAVTPAGPPRHAHPRPPLRRRRPLASGHSQQLSGHCRHSTALTFGIPRQSGRSRQ